MNLRVARFGATVLLLIAGVLVYHEVTKRYGGQGGQYIKLTSPFLKCAPAQPHRLLLDKGCCTASHQQPRRPCSADIFVTS